MTYAATLQVTVQRCGNCLEYVEPRAKFCGECGHLVGQPGIGPTVLEDGASPARVPSFATSGIPVESARTRELIEEANKLSFLLARERVFLYLHWLVFFLINLFGFWMAWKCYAEFIGDEMSKMMMASTPFLFVNSLALLCIVPIKGTRAQIAHLKERIQYLRFNIEFGHLNL